jgi:Aldehyde dehydrogenase family
MIDQATEQHVAGAVPKQLYVGGLWVDASDGATFAVVDPSTGAALCSVADALPEDGMAALRAATDAQASFAAVPPRQRADMLMNAFRLLHERIDDLALADDTGDGQAAGRVPRRDRLCRRVALLVDLVQEPCAGCSASRAWRYDLRQVEILLLDRIRPGEDPNLKGSRGQAPDGSALSRSRSA